MLMALEIILTIAAWKKGWKAWALVPLGIPVVVGFFIGLTMGFSAFSNGSAIVAGLMFDLIAVAVLIGMIANPRVKSESPTPVEKTDDSTNTEA
ncbi:MAG: hypothetical protein PHO26_00265 [Dehalococcoidia bacterium]|nr:hypothetical protein [Dehalococcoidia bacterium]MDD5494184.1 hypothetical protein [Dehalococcoidia bacterium]